MSRAVLLVLSLGPGLFACNRGRVHLKGDETADEIDELCDDHKSGILEEDVQVVFERTTEDCPWGVDGNQNMLDTYLTARVEQTEALDVTDKLLLCDMDLDMSGLVPGEVQLLHYDDYFFFTFNDIVLASSHRPAVEGLDTDEGMPIYDWSRIVGTAFPVGDAPFCLGEESGDGECQIPSTDVQGPITLRFGIDVVNELSARALAEDRLDFGFVTTGDNDPGTDCRHDEFGFTVKVEYLEAG